MADFAPPPGPPPPKVPEGFKAVWNNEYKEWFFVNIYTKQSQWDKPTQPVYPPDQAPPPGPPPGYSGGDGRTSPYSDRKTNPYDAPNTESDAALAARLQAEEDARARGAGSSRDAQSDYQNTPMPQTSYDQPQQQKSKGGFLGKLFSGGKTSGSGQPQYGGGSPYPQQGGYAQPGYGGGYQAQPAPYPPQGYQQQQPYGGGYAQGGYGGGYGGGYAQPQQAAPKKSGGMGAMGGAALGLGGGLIGGMLLEDAIEDHDQNEYNQGYQQGEENQQDYDDGGGFGGDDGGDF